MGEITPFVAPSGISENNFGERILQGTSAQLVRALLQPQPTRRLSFCSRADGSWNSPVVQRSEELLRIFVVGVQLLHLVLELLKAAVEFADLRQTVDMLERTCDRVGS